MTSREKMAIWIAPLFLRLAISITFIWAGLGKLMAEMPVSGEQAAVLANMNVVHPVAKAVEITPAPTPAPAPTVHPEPKPEPKSEPVKPAPSKDPAKDPAKDPKKEPAKDSKPSGPPALVHVIAQQSGPAPSAKTYTAADFPTPVTVARLYGVALKVHDAANPTNREGKPVSFVLAPLALAQGNWPVYLAWAAALVELLGGLLVLFGLFTRLAALGIAGVMGAAIWLTQIGPAIQSGNTTLGFLPLHAPYDVAAWQTILWQFSLCMAACSLFFAGSGGLSMDKLIAGRPVVNKPKPASAPAK